MPVLLDLFLTFARIGAFTFGGGYAMLPLIDHACVEQKGWLTADELMDVTVVAESTPGPIAINCATYTGYKQAGLPGAVAATLGVVLPSFFIILLLASFLERLLAYPLAARAFRGIRVAVGVIIVQAALKMIRKRMKKPAGRALAIALIGLSCAAVLIFGLLGRAFSTILLILIAGLLGVCAEAASQKGNGKGGARK